MLIERTIRLRPLASDFRPLDSDRIDGIWVYTAKDVLEHQCGY